jgi:hypothetical protein
VKPGDNVSVPDRLNWSGGGREQATVVEIKPPAHLGTVGGEAPETGKTVVVEYEDGKTGEVAFEAIEASPATPSDARTNESEQDDGEEPAPQ